MGQATRWVVGCVCAGTFASGAFVASCSGGINGDAGADASSDAPSSDASTACPAYTGSSQLCKGLVSHCNACGPGDASACEQAHFTQNCEAQTTVYSQAFLNAYATCATTCDDDATTGCQVTQLAAATLTPAQAKAVGDYCNACADASAVCTSNYGKLFVQYSDTLASQIDTTCAASCANYFSCLLTVAQQSTPVDPCD